MDKQCNCGKFSPRSDFYYNTDRYCNRVNQIWCLKKKQILFDIFQELREFSKAKTTMLYGVIQEFIDCRKVLGRGRTSDLPLNEVVHELAHLLPLFVAHHPALLRLVESDRCSLEV